jgi:hypothetical protein
MCGGWGMFYYSETKYLYEMSKDGLKDGIRGFAKITFRDRKGTIQVHFDEAIDGTAAVAIYKASEYEKIHKISEENAQMKKGELKFTYKLEEQFLSEECWFGCLIPKETELSENIKESVKQEDEYSNSESPEQENTKSEMPQEPDNLSNAFINAAERRTCKFTEKMEEYANNEPVQEQSQEKESAECQRAENSEDNFWKSIYLSDLSQIGKVNKEWERFRQNSFLLHGFYNYKHVLATENLLGVPGNYYEKEKHLAAMFGFGGFLPVKELESYFIGESRSTNRQPTVGIFGYYFCTIH